MGPSTSSPVILTGASRGIGRALALALPASTPLHALARDRAALDSLVSARPPGATVAHVVDLSSLSDAERAGRALAEAVPAGARATLVHCAGIWPAQRELVDVERNGERVPLERAFIVNCLSPLALQRPLLAPGPDGGRLARILVVGAGLMIKGAFTSRTPSGADFHWMRTYASTKLAFAVAMRDVARDHPELDVAVVHPGVVRTELGARRGLMGWLLDVVKRSWEAPDVTGARLARILARERWAAAPGEARWLVEENEQPWPSVADDVAVRAAVRDAVRDAVREGVGEALRV